jgi:hypothetical protein
VPDPGNDFLSLLNSPYQLLSQTRRWRQFTVKPVLAFGIHRQTDLVETCGLLTLT